MNWTIFVLAAYKKDKNSPKKVLKVLQEFLYFMLLDIGISPFI